MAPRYPDPAPRSRKYDVPGATIRSRQIKEHEILVRAERGEWVSLRLEESTGSVCILSDFGHWSYFWPPAHRGENLPKFLSRLCSDYAGGKFLGAALDVYDPQKTAAFIRETILEERRDGGLTKTQARDEWILSRDLDSFEIWWNETELSDASEMRCTSTDHSWTAFWDRLWKPFVRPELLNLAEEAEEVAPQTIRLDARSFADAARIREMERMNILADPAMGPFSREELGELVAELDGPRLDRALGAREVMRGEAAAYVVAPWTGDPPGEEGPR